MRRDQPQVQSDIHRQCQQRGQRQHRRPPGQQQECLAHRRNRDQGQAGQQPVQRYGTGQERGQEPRQQRLRREEHDPGEQRTATRSEHQRPPRRAPQAHRIARQVSAARHGHELHALPENHQAGKNVHRQRIVADFRNPAVVFHHELVSEQQQVRRQVAGVQFEAAAQQGPGRCRFGSVVRTTWQQPRRRQPEHDEADGVQAGNAVYRQRPPQPPGRAPQREQEQAARRMQRVRAARPPQRRQQEEVRFE